MDAAYGILDGGDPECKVAAGPYNDSMSMHPDVLIVGGGVIGLTTAYYLARAGASVTVLDQGDLGQQASWAGAGIVPPGNPRRARTPLDCLRAISAELYPVLSAQLRGETGIDNGFVVCGGIELPEGDETPQTADWREEGIAFEALDADGLLTREPGLSTAYRRGYYLPGMAQVRNPRHLKALIAACERRTVGLRPGCAVRGFHREDNRLCAVETEQGRLTAGQFLVAAGAWTDDVLAPLIRQPGIFPVRGQIALLNTGIAAIRPIIQQGSCYLVPRPDGRLLAGSTEENAGFDARPTAGGIAGLLAFAQRLLPSLGDAILERSWAGLRPGSPDGMPFLGPAPDWNNLFVAAGHFRAGIQLSPATGLGMMELLLGRPSTVPLLPFRLDRPLGPPVQTAFRS